MEISVDAGSIGWHFARVLTRTETNSVKQSKRNRTTEQTEDLEDSVLRFSYCLYTREFFMHKATAAGRRRHKLIRQI